MDRRGHRSGGCRDQFLLFRRGAALEGTFDLLDGTFEDLLELAGFPRLGVSELLQQLDARQLIDDLPHLLGIVGYGADAARQETDKPGFDLLRRGGVGRSFTGVGHQGDQVARIRPFR
ncbi:hypothetical protein [Bradyrhizobium sp. WYCCWR 12699]|uniref:hypothetical protein n=1 Tax=Bradyrhizobium sp. WYCCWR 12699 TaxID=3064203 RepID=UPI0028A3F577|nr:hypothetical protein [Bradyrhizobium sp. WYCCWR 12699]MDT4743687.1 hypothetical protein [Bradyrhizobium sp. WYCCWR 12699]